MTLINYNFWAIALSPFLICHTFLYLCWSVMLIANNLHYETINHSPNHFFHIMLKK